VLDPAIFKKNPPLQQMSVVGRPDSPGLGGEIRRMKQRAVLKCSFVEPTEAKES
jgi:hypothetical protein